MKEKRKKGEVKNKKNGRKGGPVSTDLQCSNNEGFDELGSELVCTPRDRGSSLLWLFFV